MIMMSLIIHINGRMAVPQIMITMHKVVQVMTGGIMMVLI